MLTRSPEPTEGADRPVDSATVQVDSVGFVRKLLRSRKWYKADWWFVVVGAALATLIVVLGLFPGVFAPFDPQAQVGPRLLPPMSRPDVAVLVVPGESGIRGLEDLASEDRTPIGVERGQPWGQSVRDLADQLTDESSAQGGDLRIRVRIERYETLSEALDALEAGEVTAVAASSNGIEEHLGDHPALVTVGVGEDGTQPIFVLGTNQVGQDVLSRIIWGARVAVIVGFVAPMVAALFGVPFGLGAGFTGGGVDRTLTVTMDSLYAFPGLILAIAITAVLGPGLINVIAALGVIYIPTYFRVIRAQTLSVKELAFVESARSLGTANSRILSDFVAPNVIPSAVIIFSVSIADAILTGAGLSYLGLGLPPDVADWGMDLARGQSSIGEAWWLVVFPGVMITLAVLAFTLLGEGLIEIHNPRLRDH